MLQKIIGNKDTVKPSQATPVLSSHLY